MLRLLRMDLYRLFRSKSFYICFGCVVFVELLTYGLLYIIANPELRAFLVQMGATISGDMTELESSLSVVSTLDLFHQTIISGGFLPALVSIFASIFICIDFDSGFMKNITTAHENKWDYILSKTCCFTFINFVYVAVSYLIIVIVNILGGGYFESAPLSNVLFYLLSLWMIINGFTALTLLICMITRNKAFGVAAAICLGSGVIVTLIGSILTIFNLQEIVNYTLYMNIDLLPQSYIGIESLKPLIIGFVFVVIYTLISKVVLAKKDV